MILSSEKYAIFVSLFSLEFEEKCRVNNIQKGQQ